MNVYVTSYHIVSPKLSELKAFCSSQQRHCAPAALDMYSGQQRQESGLHGSSHAGLYAALVHLNQAKRTGPEPPPARLPSVTAMKEASWPLGEE